MSLIKKISLTLLAIFIATPIYLAIFKHSLTLLSLSNSFFMLGLLFLMVAAFIGILLSGFFDLFQKNMKETFAKRRNQKKHDYVKFSAVFSKKPTYWLACAGVLITLSLILGLFA